MGDSQVLPSPICNLTAIKVVTFNNPIYQTTESFHSDNEEVRREGITLSQTPRAWKETSRGSVYEDRERGYGDAPFYPAQPPAAESHPTQDLEQKLLADTIVSFFYIQLADQTTFFPPQGRIHYLVGDQNNIQNLTSLNESILGLRNHLVHDPLDPVS